VTGDDPDQVDAATAWLAAEVDADEEPLDEDD
jgi:hypothetical protein